MDVDVPNDTQARSWWFGIEPKIIKLEGVPAQLAAVLGQYRRGIQEAKDPRLAPEGQREKRQQVREQALEAIRTIEQDASATHAEIVAAVAAAKRKDAPADTNRALLEEMQGQRVWQRNQRLLDGQQDQGAALRMLQQTIADAKESLDVGTLRILAEEVPTYLQSRGWAAVATSAATVLQEAMAPHLPAKERLAREIEQNLPGPTMLMTAGINMSRGEVSGTGTPVAGLPGRGGLVAIG